MHHQFARLLGLLTAFALIGTAAASPSVAHPHAVLIVVDDMGYGDIGCYGSPDVPTPHIDSLTKTGTRFTDAYVSCAVCSPSRAALLTGSYPARNSLNFNHLPGAKTGIHPNEITIPELLKQANYATAMVGKWHLGDAKQFLPTRNGFDSWLGLPYSNDMWPYHPKVTRTGPENATAKAVRERAESTGFDGQGQGDGRVDPTR